MNRVAPLRQIALTIIGAAALAASFAGPVGAQAPKRGGSRPAATPVPTPPPTADDPVTLPFGFSWGDTPEMVKTALPRVKAKIKQVKPLGSNGEIWFLTGVEVPGLRESRAIFQEKQLVGLDLEYGSPDWPVEKFRGAMASLRRKMETMFAGPGNLLKRGPVEGSEEAGVDQILTGYEWRRNDTIVLLVYFSAEKVTTVKKEGEPSKDAFRSLTIRYRYQAESPEAKPPPPPGSTPEATPETVAPGSPAPGDSADPVPVKQAGVAG